MGDEEKKIEIVIEDIEPIIAAEVSVEMAKDLNVHQSETMGSDSKLA